MLQPKVGFRFKMDGSALEEAEPTESEVLGAHAPALMSPCSAFQSCNVTTRALAVKTKMAAPSCEQTGASLQQRARRESLPDRRRLCASFRLDSLPFTRPFNLRGDKETAFA